MVTTVTELPQYVQTLYETVGYKPTPAQEEVVSSRKRYIVVAGGEQAGKSVVAAKYLLARFAETEDPGLYWLVAADYERTRAEFEYLVEDFGKLGVLKEATKRVDPGRIILFDGTRIETKSGKDPRTLAMRAPNGILGCEASQLDLETYHRLRSRLAPRRGWLFMSGTMEGSLGWYPQLVQAWSHGLEDEVSYSLPSYSNFHLYPGGREDPEMDRLRAASSDEFFMERIEGIPCPPKGLVFHEFRPDAHIKDVEWIPEEPVHLWIDPGYGDACAVMAVQIIDGMVRVFDEIYERGRVTSEIIQIARNRPWWGKDGECNVHFGVVDVYGTQHHNMPAVAEQWLAETGLYLSSRRVRINEGTERLKTFLKVDPLTGAPRIMFDNKCRGILSEFGALSNPFDGQTRVYRWKTDRDGNIVGDIPEDRNNHGIKATIYGLVDLFGYANAGNRKTIRVKHR